MIVWYDKHEDQIFHSGMLDTVFFGLQKLEWYYPKLKWDRFEILDFLKEQE